MRATLPMLKAARSGEPLAEQAGRLADRATAGRLLAERVRASHGEWSLVLALPAGGVAVGGELARALRLPLDVLVARSFRLPAEPTGVVGALSEGGGLCFNRAALRRPGVTLLSAWRAAWRTRQDVIALVATYRGGRRLPLLNRRSILLVDDGLGSGLPQLAALQALRRAHGHEVVVATPYASAAVVRQVARCADGLIVLRQIEDRPGERAASWSEPLDDEQAAGLLKRYRRQFQAI